MCLGAEGNNSRVLMHLLIVFIKDGFQERRSQQTTLMVVSYNTSKKGVPSAITAVQGLLSVMKLEMKDT